MQADPDANNKSISCAIFICSHSLVQIPCSRWLLPINRNDPTEWYVCILCNAYAVRCVGKPLVPRAKSIRPLYFNQFIAFRITRFFCRRHWYRCAVVAVSVGSCFLYSQNGLYADRFRWGKRRWGKRIWRTELYIIWIQIALLAPSRLLWLLTKQTKKRQRFVEGNSISAKCFPERHGTMSKMRMKGISLSWAPIAVEGRANKRVIERE